MGSAWSGKVQTSIHCYICKRDDAYLGEEKLKGRLLVESVVLVSSCACVCVWREEREKH